MSVSIERIVAIDPGDHMGWAFATASEKDASVYAAGTLTPGELFYLLEHWTSTNCGTGEGPCDVVVLESFHLFKPEEHRGSDIPTLQYIGAIKYIVARFSAVRLVLLAPGVKGPAKGKARQLGKVPIVGEDPMSKADQNHCKDAQLLAWAYIWGAAG